MELIITLVADDRPGIVEQVALVVARHGGNWQESRLATLADKFAGIVRVSVAEADHADLEAGLLALREESVVVQVAHGASGAALLTRRQTLSVVGNDRPGIVREVSQALAAAEVNVVELATTVESASMSGGVLFRAHLEVGLSAHQSVVDVVAALEGLSPDLMIDLVEPDPHS